MQARHRSRNLRGASPHPLRSSPRPKQRSTFAADVCAALALMVIALILTVLAARIGGDERAVQACIAAGGHAYGSYVDSVRCTR